MLNCQDLIHPSLSVTLSFIFNLSVILSRGLFVWNYHSYRWHAPPCL